jgi:hypothetical protein
MDRARPSRTSRFSSRDDEHSHKARDKEAKCEHTQGKECQRRARTRQEARRTHSAPAAILSPQPWDMSAPVVAGKDLRVPLDSAWLICLVKVLSLSSHSMLAICDCNVRRFHICDLLIVHDGLKRVHMNRDQTLHLPCRPKPVTAGHP